MAVSGKERTRKHREKKKAESQGFRSKPDEVSEKILSAYRNQKSTYGLKEHDRHKETFSSHFFLIETQDDNFHILNRQYNPLTEKTFLHPASKNKYKNKVEAQAEFDLIRNKQCQAWRTLDHNYGQACDLDIVFKKDKDAKASRYPLSQLSFQMALYEVKTNGYSIIKDSVLETRTGTKQSVKNSREELNQRRRRIVNVLKNPILPPYSDDHAWSEVLFNMFDSFAKDTDEEGTTSIGTFSRKVDCVAEMIKSLKKYRHIFNGVHVVYDEVDRIYKEVLQSNVYNAKYNTGTIVPKGHYKPIAIDKLRTLLDTVWNEGKGKNEYNTVMLALSTALRPSELELLINSPSEHITESHFLNYSGGKLITKTLSSTDISDITNPHIEIVSRIILFHMKPTFNKGYFKKDNKASYRSRLDLNDCFLRRFRTTSATYLAYCGNIKNSFGGASHQEVQLRLGHTTTTMATTTYAKQIPSSRNPRNYFNFTGEIEINNKKIHQESSLWDLWLLNDFISRHIADLSTEKGKQAFKTICLKEAGLYNRSKSGEDGDISGSSY